MARSNVHLFIAVSLLAACVTDAAPFEGQPKGVESDYNAVTDGITGRHKRATCRIPIIGDWVNDSACAAGCIARGRAGGYCLSKICHCREETMLDVLRKRFNH